MTKTQRHSWQSIWFVAIAITAGGPSLHAASLTLTASPNPALFGERITLTANVLPSAATGKVTFYDGNVVLGTAAISGGHATLSAAIAATGNRNLVARYLGDAQNSAATSPVISESIRSVPSFGFTPSTVTTGLAPHAAAAADVNGDGKLDLIFAGSSNAVTVVLGTGSGTFQNRIFSPPFSTNVGGGYLRAADFDLDGKMDVVVGGISELKVLFGNGDGTFGTGDGAYGGTITLPTAPGPVEIADFNGDGIPDIAVMHRIGWTVGILLGRGDGTFSPPFEYPLGTFACATYYPSGPCGGYETFLAIGDLNGDGVPDVVTVQPVIGESSRVVIVLLGNPDGSLHAPVSYPLTTLGVYQPDDSFVLEDLDGDGLLDLVVLPGYGAMVGVLRGNGDGSFAAATRFYTVIGNNGVGHGVAVVDVSGDGKLDVISTLRVVQSTPAAEVGLSLGNGDGTLQIANLEVTSRPDLRSVILGDFNGDGMVDFAELNPNAGEAMIFLGALPPLLQIAKTHAGNFTQGQIGAQFTITISNAGGSSTAGTVTVTDWSGGNMLITSMSGSGWICVGTSCYRNDVLPVGASYPTITVLANILTLNGGTLPAVINEAFVSGGGALSAASAIDTAQIVQPVPIQYQLTTAVGTGGVAAGSISPASGYFNTGTIVQILATPNAGYSFAGFSGDLTGLTNPQNLTLSSNRSVTANFQVVTLSVPVLAAPASGATGAPISQNLSWNTVTNALSYDIYFGTTNPPPSVTSTSGTIYAPGPLAFGTTYFWRIVARNGSVTASSPVVSFQTVPNGAQPLSVGPASGTAGRQLFTFVARDSVSVNNIQYAQFLFSKSGITALNACYISYDPAANVFYLLSDDMTQWYGLLGGSANTVGNAQCTIYGATSGSVKSGTDLTTSVDISFRSGFAGVKGIYQFAGDMSAGGSGWQSIGTWNDTGDPSAVELISLSPNSGTGVSQIFTAVMKDGDGATTIPFVQFVMNAGLSGFNGCFIHYDRASNVFFLLNDLGTVFSGLVAGSGTVSNSQCTLNGTGSGGTSIGSNLTVTYSLTFSAGFAGTKQIYMHGVDNTGVIEVWHQMGTWTR